MGTSITAIGRDDCLPTSLDDGDILVDGAGFTAEVFGCVTATDVGSNVPSLAGAVYQVP